jgi:hypothetical protein
MFLFLTLVLLHAPEVRGEYLCHGVTLQGDYDILLQVEKKDDNYFFTWRTNEVKAKGLGVRNGDSLAVVYVNLQGRAGVVLYKVFPARLEGTWATGDGKSYSETCSIGLPSRA